MKKVFSSVLALAMLVSMFAVFAVGMSAATEPDSYTGGALTNYRNELLNEKFGANFAWLQAYTDRHNPGYDDTIWGLICDDIDTMDYLKNNGGTDAQGRAAIDHMKLHIAVIDQAPASYTGSALTNFRNAILCARFGGDVGDPGSWAWLTPYSNRYYEGYDSAKWGLVCDDIDNMDYLKNNGGTDSQGREAIKLMDTHLKDLVAETKPSDENTILDSSSAYYFKANEGLQTLIVAGTQYEQKGPATGNNASTYFAYYYNYYYYRVTLPENQAASTAVAYKALVDKVYNWIYGEEFAGKVVYGFTGIADTLESAWQAMRAEIGISNALKDKRNAYMDEHGLWDNNLGKYTADSWATYWAAVEAIDSAAKDGTDADCNAAYEAFLQAAANLKETGTMFDPQRKAAYDRATSDLVGKPLYMHYVDRAYGLFTNSELWEDPEAVQAFLDKAEEADMLFIEPYDDSIDYTVWFPAGLSAEELANADMLMEQLWNAAREVAYIGKAGLDPKMWELTQSVGDSSLYTSESYELWQMLWSDASTAFYNVRDNTNSTDQDGYDAVQGLIETFGYLEPLASANATYNYYEKQVAKLGSISCTFIDEFNGLYGFVGLASDFDTAVKALATSFNAARNEFVFGAAFQKAVDKLAVKYAGAESVVALCESDDVRILANTGTVEECAAYIQQINDAVAALDEDTAAKLAAKDACFGNSDRGTFVVNYKTAYNGYKALVTLAENQGVAYSNYCALLDEYNAAYESDVLLSVSEYEDMRQTLEEAWWAMRKEAGVGLVFQSELAAAAAAGNAAQQEYVAEIAPIFYSKATDAEIDVVWAEFNALAA